MEALPHELDGASGIHIEKESFTHAQVGNALLLAGHADAALRYLEADTLACNWLHWPVQHTHALLHLGQAHEAMGQTEGACEAYHRVVARWAIAPKSSTRDTAKARLQALACGTEARRAPHRSALTREGGPGASAEPDEERQDGEISKTITRGAEGCAAERGPACAEAKRAAIAKTMCAKQKSVEGDCDCNRRSNEWVCAAMMAVTCN